MVVLLNDALMTDKEMGRGRSDYVYVLRRTCVSFDEVEVIIDWGNTVIMQ